MTKEFKLADRGPRGNKADDADAGKGSGGTGGGSSGSPAWDGSRVDGADPDPSASACLGLGFRWLGLILLDVSTTLVSPLESVPAKLADRRLYRDGAFCKLGVMRAVSVWAALGSALAAVGEE